MYLAANWYLFQKFQYSNGYIQIICFQTTSCIQFFYFLSLTKSFQFECRCRNLSKISPVRRYSLINVYTYDFKTFGPVPLCFNSSSKNVTYFLFSTNGYPLSYFFNFNPFFLLFSYFSLPFSFSFCRIWAECAHSFLLTYLGGTFSPLLDISEWNFFPRCGGGGARTPPPLRTRLINVTNFVYTHKKIL